MFCCVCYSLFPACQEMVIYKHAYFCVLLCEWLPVMFPTCQVISCIIVSNSLCLMLLPCGTISWKKKTTRKSSGRQVIYSSCWYRGLESSFGSSGILVTSKLTLVRTRCCRLWSCVPKRNFRSPSKVSLQFVHTCLFLSVLRLWSVLSFPL